MAKRNHLEDDEQKEIVFRLKTDAKYRTIRALWSFDSTGSIKVSAWKAKQLKLLGRRTGQPDFHCPGLFISKHGSIYAGIYIEFKANNNTPYKKNGELYANDHLKTQSDYLELLKSHGCYTSFAVGVKGFFKLLDRFLDNHKLRKR